MGVSHSEPQWTCRFNFPPLETRHTQTTVQRKLLSLARSARTTGTQTRTHTHTRSESRAAQREGERERELHIPAHTNAQGERKQAQPCTRLRRCTLSSPLALPGLPLALASLHSPLGSRTTNLQRCNLPPALTYSSSDRPFSPLSLPHSIKVAWQQLHRTGRCPLLQLRHPPSLSS